MSTVREHPRLESRVAELRWYHTLELPGGVVTPGEYDLRPIVGRLPWPASLAGRRCLDVGGRDGFYAFEMERRGASEVVSVDIEDPSKLDFPGPRPAEALVREELEAGNRAFELAHDALSSGVVRRLVSVYDLDPDELGRFDFAVVGTLLHHLRDPVRALVSVRRVLDGELLVNDAVIGGLDSVRRRPMAELRVNDGPFWSLCNPAGLRRLVESAGFDVLRSGGPYLIPYGPGGPKEPREPLLRSLRPPLGAIPERLVLRRGAPHAFVLAAPAGHGG